MGFKGTDSRQSGDRIVFRASLKDSAGAKVTTGTASLYLYEVQSDGSLKSYDFSSNTFKTTALTTETAGLTHRTGNNGTTNTGIWTSALTTVTGFTRGGTYIAVVSHASASPPQQEREFVYGDAEGDFIVDVSGRPVAASVAGDVNGKILGNGVTDPAGPGVWALGDAGQNLANYDQIGIAGVNLSSIPDSAGVTTLLSRVTAAVATAAGQTSILNAITALNNLSALANLYGSPLLEIPDAGSTTFAFTLVVRDNEGKLVNLDANPTITAANAAGTDRSANLSAVAHPATGRYTFTYSVSSAAAEESLRITCSGTVSAEGRYVEWIGAVVNYDSITMLADIQTKAGTAATQSTTAATQATNAATSAASADGKLTGTRLGKLDSMTFTTANRLDVTAVAVSDKTGYSLSASQTFSTTGAVGSITGVDFTNTLAMATRWLGMVELSAGLYRYTVAALANAPTGGGPGGAVPTAEENAAATVAALAGQITTSTITPVDADGVTTIVQGDDYASGTANPSLTYTINGYTGPATAGATVKWQAIPKRLYEREGASAAELTLSNGTATLSGSTLVLSYNLTSSNTASLSHTSPPEPKGNYVVIASLISQAGAVMTQVIDTNATVLKRLS